MWVWLGNETNFHSFNIKKDQTFSSLDSEAALPSSKHLHHALEAMSVSLLNKAKLIWKLQLGQNGIMLICNYTSKFF